MIIALFNFCGTINAQNIMKVDHPEQYKFIKFEVARDSLRYKYYLVLCHNETGRLKHVPFGGKHPDGTPYDQYCDRALGFYAKFDHGDRQRRDRYRARHAGEDHAKFSSGWASWKFLW